MNFPKRDLEIVPEGNDEQDRPTCWAMLVCRTNKNHYIWISKYDADISECGYTVYIVEDSIGNNLADKKVYKTLQGAKRKAEEIAYRQEDTGCFTN